MRRPTPCAAAVGADLVHAGALARRLEALPGLDAALFTAAERAQAACRARPARALAACFAAKEAFLKALGRGLAPSGLDPWLQQVEVALERGQPCLRLSGAPAGHLQRRGQAASLSLSVAGEHVLAMVLLVPAAAPAGRLA